MADEKTSNRVDRSLRKSGVQLALDLGARLAVSFGEQTENNRIAGELVGLVHFEYLIARLPGVPGLLSRMIPGAPLTVRFVTGGELCGFRSQVLTHVVKPSFLLFFEYPEVMEILALRQHKRVHCALPAQVHSARGEAPGVVSDLSQGGCQLLINLEGQQELRRTVIGDSLVLSLPLSGNGTALPVTASVRSVEVATNRMQLGLSFVQAEKNFWAALEKYVGTTCLLI